VRANQPHAYKLLDAYAATFSRQFSGGEERIKSAYLWSESPGTGKTTTACALLNTYLITHFIGMVKQGKNALLRPVYFLDVNEWQTTFNRITLSVGEEAKKKVSDDFQKRMDTAMNTPFVVLDDIGVRGASEAFRSYLHAVINARVTNKLPTVYTSNLPVSELATLFGEQRLADRVRDMCVEILFVGQSKRGKR
jgi:DNA replication protein DnaC